MHEQLRGAIEAVFDSWNSKRAVDYRRFNKIPDDWGTAVNVMEMVFGNMGEDSGTGVAFTRNPNTGERALFGEYLTNAQGEDVVAGIRTPEKIADLANAAAEGLRAVQRDRRPARAPLPRRAGSGVYRRARQALHAADAQREAQRRGRGQDRARSRRRGLDRQTPRRRDGQRAIARSALPRAHRSRRRRSSVACKGLNASPGAAAGQIVFTADDAVAWKEHGRKTILVRTETTPDDVHGMIAAEGILTAKGGATSHAAVVARGMGKPCVAGCDALQIDRA